METTMSDEKPTNEPKPKADDLLKTSKDSKVELTEEELKRVAAGHNANIKW